MSSSQLIDWNDDDIPKFKMIAYKISSKSIARGRARGTDHRLLRHESLSNTGERIGTNGSRSHGPRSSFSDRPSYVTVCAIRPGLPSVLFSRRWSMTSEEKMDERTNLGKSSSSEFVRCWVGVRDCRDGLLINTSLYQSIASEHGSRECRKRDKRDNRSDKYLLDCR